MPATAIVDAKRRLVFPAAVRPGDIAQIEPVGPDVYRVTLLRPPTRERPRLIKRRGQPSVFVGGRPITSTDVRRLLEDQQ